MGYWEDEMRLLLSITAVFFAVIISAPIGLSINDSTDTPKEVEGRIKTVYGMDGRPINQSQYAKGYHRVFGETKLVNGIDTLTINSSTEDGLQDVTFIGQSTYHGRVWSLSESNTKSYRIIPIDGKRFIIKSSDTTDTATINFQVEGE
jgi:hypothetical protein